MSQEVQDNGNVEPADAAEAEAWQALEADVSGEGGGAPSADEPAATGSEPPASTEPEAAEAKGDEPAKDDGKPDPETLIRQYQTGMRDERLKRQQLEAQIAEINEAIAEARQARQQPEEQPPSIDEDPIAYFEHQQRQIRDELKSHTETAEQERQAREHAQQQQAFAQTVTSKEQEFAAQTPDYFYAADHLRSVRLSQLEQVYPSSPEGDHYAQQQGFHSAAAMRNAHLEQEVAQYASQALGMGRNPAEVFYSLAKSVGWAKPAAPEVTPQQKTEVARAGVRRAQSLSGGGGGGGSSENATVSELADLYLTDPPAADALFKKLAAQGALG